MTNQQLTIVVSGTLGAAPRQGGNAWAFLQYLLGLRQLGHDVYFVEPVQADALQPAHAGLRESSNAAYFCQVLRDFGLETGSALVLEGTRQSAGLPYDNVVDVFERAVVLINISGRLTDAELLRRVPVRVYLDLDPAFTQLWNAACGIDMHFEGHTHFVTIGQAIGQADCDIPTCGLSWVTMQQPIVLHYWPPVEDVIYDALTTVANWRGYGSAEYKGEFYGQKAHSLRQFIELPRLTDERFVLALGIHPDEVKDLKLLTENNWQLVDPVQIVDSPANYQRFIQGSKGEFGIAKSGYVKSRCGWFSDRSVCYLASGRPVVAQETGFSRFLPTGEGLFAFKTIDDVLTAIDALDADYGRHAKAARMLAEQHFDSDKVLTRLLQKVGTLPS